LKASNASANKPNTVPRKIVVDANPIMSALISDQSAASRVFWHGTIEEFATTTFTKEEVRKYFPRLAKKSGRNEELLELDLKLLPLVVYEPQVYQGQRLEAEKRIGARDPDDMELLSLSLQLKVPLWSNDRDFEVAGVRWHTTAALLKLLEN